MNHYQKLAAVALRLVAVATICGGAAYFVCIAVALSFTGLYRGSGFPMIAIAFPFPILTVILGAILYALSAPVARLIGKGM